MRFSAALCAPANLLRQEQQARGRRHRRHHPAADRRAEAERLQQHLARHPVRKVALMVTCAAQNSEGLRKVGDFGATALPSRHDHDSFHRRFHTRLPASSPRLPGTRAHRAATSGECPAAAAPRSASAVLYRPATLGVALPGLAAGPPTPWCWSSPQPWSSGIAKAFGHTGGGDHAVRGGPRRVPKSVI